MLGPRLAVGAGIAVCGTCGAHMVGARAGGNVRTYRCSASLALAKKKCPAPATTTAAPLEGLVRESLREAWAGEGYVVGSAASGTVAEVEADLTAAEAELQAFAGDLTARQALGDTYGQHLQARAAAVEQARSAYRTVARRSAGGVRVMAADLLDTDDPAELRELFAGAVAGVTVERGRGPIADRLRVVLKGEDGVAGVPAA
jgi:hypothetical protein